jgi:hypothetical protein
VGGVGTGVVTHQDGRNFSSYIVRNAVENLLERCFRVIGNNHNTDTETTEKP